MLDTLFRFYFVSGLLPIIYSLLGAFWNSLMCISFSGYAPGPAPARGKSGGCSQEKGEGCQVLCYDSRILAELFIWSQDYFSAHACIEPRSKLLPTSLAELVSWAVTLSFQATLSTNSLLISLVLHFLSSQHYRDFLCIPEWQILILQNL